VRSTTQRYGSTTKPFLSSLRLTIAMRGPKRLCHRSRNLPGVAFGWFGQGKSRATVCSKRTNQPVERAGPLKRAEAVARSGCLKAYFSCKTTAARLAFVHGAAQDTNGSRRNSPAGRAPQPRMPQQDLRRTALTPASYDAKNKFYNALRNCSLNTR